jgi:hypothetical protein
VICLRNLYNDHIPLMPSDPGPEHVPDDTPFGALQFTSDEVESVMQYLDGITLIILKNCASAFAKTLSLLFDRSMATSVFFNRWEVSYVTPIFKKGRHNIVEDYRGVALLSAIPKHFELLVYRGMYNDLKKLMFID